MLPFRFKLDCRVFWTLRHHMNSMDTWQTFGDIAIMGIHCIGMKFQQLCGLEHCTWISIYILVSRKWVNFQTWVNHSHHVQPSKQHQLSRMSLSHLHLAVRLQQLSDRHLVLLQSPLHQLGAADVDGTLHMWRIVLGKRPAVNHQQTARSSLDEARQALDVHDASLSRTFLSCHVLLTGWSGHLRR